jgi:uncharacterized protein (TIGR02284 family)
MSGASPSLNSIPTSHIASLIQKKTAAFPAQCVLTHMSQQEEIISTVNGLIETLKDGQEGFRQASEGVENSELKSLFSKYSLQRSKFAGELQNEVITLGENNPENTSSAAGAVHRAWINLKSAITSGDDHAVLAECERGEDSAVKEYKKALDEESLSLPVRATISRQYMEVQSAHDRIRELRDAAEKN